ncbi:MAG: hypothetical protein AMXMBFR64_12550 [Myxococcales bacterium]
MSSSKKTQDVLNHLEITTDQGSAAGELVFDARTGELVVRSQGATHPSPDETVVDQIAQDGFFAWGGAR